MARPNHVQTLLDSIPQPELIRDRLARLFAEARLLRGLLRLSESKTRCLSRRRRHNAERQGVVCAR